MHLNITSKTKSRKVYRLICVLILSVFSFASCSKNVSSISFIALGTNCKISIATSNKKLQKYVDFVYKEDDKFSYRKENSEIALINENAGIKPVRVSYDVYSLIKDAINFFYETDGAFNPLILPLVKLWGFDTGIYRVPNSEEINKALLLTNIDDIELNDDENSVFLKKSGMGLDLGGIAKGYVSDELYKLFKEDNIKEGVLNLGGNVFVFGDRDYKVALQKPYEKRGEYDILETVRNEAVITSGAYERFFEKDGKKYHHIINPETGYPSEIIFDSVTVIAENAEMSDAWSTAIFIKGENAINKFMSLHEDAKVVVQ